MDGFRTPEGLLSKLRNDADAPLVVKLDAQRLAQAPFFGAKAQQLPQEPSPESVFEGSGRVGGQPGRKPPAADERQH